MRVVAHVCSPQFCRGASLLIWCWDACRTGGDALALWASEATGDAQSVGSGVRAVSLMNFGAGHGRVKATRHYQLFLGPYGVLVVLVQRIHDARVNRVCLARGKIGDRAFAGHAIDA